MDRHACRDRRRVAAGLHKGRTRSNSGELGRTAAGTRFATLQGNLAVVVTVVGILPLAGHEARVAVGPLRGKISQMLGSRMDELAVGQADSVRDEQHMRCARHLTGNQERGHR